MADFIIRFLLCNLLISGIIVFLLAVRYLFRNSLSARLKYHLWFLLLGLMAVPFIPFRLAGYSQLFYWFQSLVNAASSNTGNTIEPVPDMNTDKNTEWLNDFTLSLSSKTPSIAGFLLSMIWIAGILVMTLFTVRASLHLHNLKRSALPLQNPEILRLYELCLKELKITKKIPIYSTAYLRSPAIAGFLRPCIYFPICLISAYNGSEMLHTQGTSPNPWLFGANGLCSIRYMLLHELQHYRHKDTLANSLMNLARILYWFNPMIWLALREMQNDREVACDSSVLEMLEEDSYEDYGNTLINFAENISHTSIPFAVTLKGSMLQMKRRIINIAAYEKPDFKKRLKGMTAFLLTTILLLGLAPILSTDATENNHYHWKSASKNISLADLSSYFDEYEGSFVLYNLEQDAWSIYNMEHAVLRRSPDSTYKIYDALFGLEEGIITPEDSFMTWDGTHYPFDEWNSDQTLLSAMRSSVNWYFQNIDIQLGISSAKNYIRKIGYGNEHIDGNITSYWLESSLKISPIEQAELLIKLYNNNFGFRLEHTNAVKDAICLSSSEKGKLYGKTGTGSIDDLNINGWFVGYTETTDGTYFFVTNIQADEEASGSNAAKITMSILTDMGIWE